MQDFGVGFRSCQVKDIGQMVPATITEALWFIDPYMERLANRSIKLPDCFASIGGLRDLKKQHKKIPHVII